MPQHFSRIERMKATLLRESAILADDSVFEFTPRSGLGIAVDLGTTTLVAQFAVPKRLLGVAVGAIFFFQMIGLVVAPSILGLVQSNAADLESGLKMVFLIGAAASGEGVSPGVKGLARRRPLGSAPESSPNATWFDMLQ